LKRGEKSTIPARRRGGGEGEKIAAGSAERKRRGRSEESKKKNIGERGGGYGLLLQVGENT